MIGTLVCLMISISALFPPLSPLLMPSTSSIRIISYCCYFQWMIVFLDRSLIVVLIVFLFRVSDELFSISLYCNSWQMSLTLLVFPIPGGPDIKIALELMFPEAFPPLKLNFTSFFLPSITTSYQFFNHSLMFLIADQFPITSDIFLGLNTSVHKSPSLFNLFSFIDSISMSILFLIYTSIKLVYYLFVS